MTYAERIRRLRADGQSVREIATAVDRRKNYIHAVLSKARKMNGLINPRGRPKKVAPNS